MVDKPTIPVKVVFSLRGQDWTRDFRVARGSTVQQLKEVMLRPDDEDLGAAEPDLSSFDLWQHGQRLPGYEAISQAMAVEFVYLGPDEGARKAARDALERGAYEERRAEERRAEERRREEQERLARRQEEQRQQSERAARRPAPAPRVPPAQLVEVVVRHAVEEMESSVTVRVASDSTFLDLRKAVMEAVGESRLSEVKVVRRVGGALTTLSNEAEIGERREFLCMGRKLELSPPAADAELEVTVTSEEDGARVVVALPASRLVRHLKDAICSQVMRGPAGQVRLLLGPRELRDGEPLEAARSLPGAPSASLSLRGLPLGPPRPVEVTVARASAEQRLTVTVLDTSTILDLRKAVAERAPGRPSVDDVRIVKPLPGAGWRSMADGERLNGQRAFSCMGVELIEEPPAPQDPAPRGGEEFQLTLWVDRALGISQQVTVARGVNVLAVKESIAAGDPTGMTKPADFELGLSGEPLDSGTLISEEHAELDLLPAAA